MPSLTSLFLCLDLNSAKVIAYFLYKTAYDFFIFMVYAIIFCHLLLVFDCDGRNLDGNRSLFPTKHGSIIFVLKKTKGQVFLMVNNKKAFSILLL